ncbi:MAG: ABC transporter ATP-binding protein [Anaerolineae bacterium]|nr:ABC transporter ATP-binding protein [Anaerolineae bacterium]
MLLSIDNMDTYYGLSHILFGVSLQVNQGECVCLMGRNGAGKTTTFRSIMGLATPKSGTIHYQKMAIHGKTAHDIAHLGIGFVPEERAIFPDLTVWENLDVARKPSVDGKTRWTLERVYDFFPQLAQRHNQLGGTLSGGEQQMLTIARTMMGNPHLLLLDEPSEGLAPLIVKSIGKLIRQIRNEGITILLAEQNTHFALDLSDRVYIIDDGRIRYSGTAQEVKAHPDIIREYLAVHQ